MLRALLALSVLASGLCCACGKAPIEPVVLTETHSIDAEVLELVAAKVAAVRASPADPGAHAALGLAYEANALWEPAEQSLANALKLDDPRRILIFHHAITMRECGQLEAGMAELQRAARELPGNPAVQQRLGQWLLEGGDSEGARAAFLLALKRVPDQPEFLTGLAGVELAHERWKEALALARRALKGAPDYRPALFACGRALQGLGRQEEAKPLLAAGVNASVTWFPDELSREIQGYVLVTGALAAEGASANARGDYARAVEFYERLVQRKPEDPDMLSNLGANLIEIGRLERANEMLQKALTIAPQSFAVHLNLSQLYMQQGKLPQARDEGMRAVEIGGTVGRTHFQLAKVLGAQKDYEGAYRELKAAVAFDARDVRMFLALAQTAMNLGLTEEARGWCRRSLEFDANSVPGRGMQGILALSAGDIDEAQAALAVLQRVAPQDPSTVRLRNEMQKAGH